MYIACSVDVMNFRTLSLREMQYITDTSLHFLSKVCSIYATQELEHATSGSIVKIVVYFISVYLPRLLQNVKEV